VVLKSLEENFTRVPGFAGATILGDGRVALILDVAYLIQHAHRTHESLAAA
jgi:two-component system chemotaxis sensor kinase CheA